ncbi:MAG: DegV family protein [Lachnospiraceae bacterium]|nr:DegV family protein [Lachnospiraceae bacterium]
MTKEEGDKYGIKVLPMPFLIDGKTYFENITLTQDEFYERLKSDVDISTSQPTIPDVQACWEEELKEYDEIVYIPMSSGLSGSTSTALAIADDYDGKVQVVDNQRISVTQFRSALDAVELANEGKSAKEIKEILEAVKFESSIYIKLDTLKYLKKGGRITPAAAAIGSALRLKPVLQIQGEKLDAFTIARTSKQAEAKMLGAIDRDIENRFGTSANRDNLHFCVAHTANYELADEFAEKIKEHFGTKEVLVSPLSLSIACHIGPGALAMAVSREVHNAYESVKNA